MVTLASAFIERIWSVVDFTVHLIYIYFFSFQARLQVSFVFSLGMCFDDPVNCFFFVENVLMIESSVYFDGIVEVMSV